MTATSRPLRALVIVLGAWTAARVVALWPADTATIPEAAITQALPFSPMIAALPGSVVTTRSPGPTVGRGNRHITTATRPRTRPEPAKPPQVAVPAGLPDVPWLPRPVPDSRVQPSETILMLPGLVFPGTHRLSGSFWALMRGDGAPALASGGQLGGSQAGIRLFYTPGPKAFAITARVSAPLSQPTGREAAFGLALRGRNFGLIAEQRIAMDTGGRNAPAVFAYGGVSDVALAGGVRLDGYGQMGIVGLRSTAAFVDGAIRVERTVVQADRSSLAIGVVPGAAPSPM